MVIINLESILRVDAALFFQVFGIHDNVHGNKRKKIPIIFPITKKYYVRVSFHFLNRKTLCL